MEFIFFQLIRFARAFSHVADFNTRIKLLTQKFLKRVYDTDRYHKLRKTFSKFYRRYYDLIPKFNIGLEFLQRQGLLEPVYNGDLVYKLKKSVGFNIFSAQFIKIISHNKKVGKRANIRNRYNKVTHLTQDTNGEVTNSQLDITNESQEVSPFPAGDHKASINRRTHKHNKYKTEIA